jgi:hypothetical protein
VVLAHHTALQKLKHLKNYKLFHYETFLASYEDVILYHLGGRVGSTAEQEADFKFEFCDEHMKVFVFSDCGTPAQQI